MNLPYLVLKYCPSCPRIPLYCPELSGTRTIVSLRSAPTVMIAVITTTPRIADGLPRCNRSGLLTRLMLHLNSFACRAAVPCRLRSWVINISEIVAESLRTLGILY
jgi:hypothetical protein